jgi:HlyD family secretion protein
MAKKKNKKRNIIIGVSFLGVIVLAIAAFAIFKSPDHTKVTVEKVSRRTITQTVSAIGKIQPETEVKISPETSGEIVQLNVKEGDTVKAGQMILRIKPDIVESQLEQSKFAAEAVKSEGSARKADLEKARADFKRSETLFAKKYISQEEFDRAKNALEAAESGLSANNLRYDQAKASFKQTQKTAARTVIYAPIDGIVTKLDVEKGEKVVGTEMMQGTEMMRISNLNVMNAEVQVDENDISYVKIGDTATVEIDAFPDRKFSGVVVETGHSAVQSAVGTQDQVTNFKVKVRLIDSDFKMRPGMSCNVEIKTETRYNVLSAPLASVTDKKSAADAPNDREPVVTTKSDENKEKKQDKPDVYVYVVSSNKVKLVKVKTGLSDKGYIEITEGLKEGETIVSGSYFAIRKELKDGAQIIIDNNAGATSKKS